MTEITLCNSNDRISQGDIFQDVDFLERYRINEGILQISKITFPHIIVLTQDCDLAQDYEFRREENENQDKILISVLVAPLYNAEFVFNGEHLSEINLKMRAFGPRKKTPSQDLIKNNNPRYHYLNFGPENPLPPSIIDFKHYFSINVDYLNEIKEKNRIMKIKELYREDISQRFSCFLSRIGLPDKQKGEKCNKN